MTALVGRLNRDLRVQPFSITQEWNRKNAATIYFAQSKIIEPGFQSLRPFRHSEVSIVAVRMRSLHGWLASGQYGTDRKCRCVNSMFYMHAIPTQGLDCSSLSERISPRGRLHTVAAEKLRQSGVLAILNPMVFRV